MAFITVVTVFNTRGGQKFDRGNDSRKGSADSLPYGHKEIMMAFHTVIAISLTFSRG